MIMFALIFLTFFIDIISASIFSRYIINSLLSCLIVISSGKNSNSKIITTLSLLSLESFIRYGRFAFDLGPLLIVSIVSEKSNKLFSNPYYTNSAILSIYLIFKTIFLEYFLLGLSFSFYNIIVELFLNIIILQVILWVSLKKQNHSIIRF